jgi:hypothetical protein
MRYRRMAIVAVPLVLLAGSLGGFAAAAVEGDRAVPIKATISGYSEVPAISTAATGMFVGNATMTQIDYDLSYSGMSSAVSAAHIHFGQRDVNGGVVAFLCGGGGKPPCPELSGSVSGTIIASDILAVPTQGIAAGELSEVLSAMQNGATYVNVHSATFGGGEVRGQIVRGP